MKTALILRPDVVLRNATQHLFSKADIRSTMAEDCKHALHLLEKHPFTFVFMDYVQAEQNPFDLVRKMKNIQPNVLVLMASVNLDPVLVSKAKEVGVDRVLPKKLDIEDVQKSLIELEFFRESPENLVG